MMELLLVRHGESTWNVAGRMQGQTAPPALTDRGRRQAVEAGANCSP
jgi:broad specificity phosphatase PhoE